MINKVTKSAKKKMLTRGGSRKDKPNKSTALIKDMIEGALQDAGGQAYLARQAEENPSAFMGLLGKIMPKDISVAGANGGDIIIRVIKTIVDPSKH